jgi:predicted tellurium resistance membrane protein TerC
MIKRNLSSILIIIAMTMNMLSFDSSNFNIESKKTWLFLGASLVLFASIILIFVNENKNKKQNKAE